MSGFKLLAIVPLAGCDNKFLKNLQIGESYKFFNNVEVELETGNTEIKKVHYPKNTSISTLYQLKNRINLEISAIVGKNGSGKSALIELLYYFIYAISAHNGSKKLIEENSDKLARKINALKKSNTKLLENNLTQIELFRILKENDLTINWKDLEGQTNSVLFLQKLLSNRSENLHKQQKDDSENEKLIRAKLAVALIYETNEGLSSLSFSNGKLCLKNFDLQGKFIKYGGFDFSSFFYSVSLNYSHHSLNSKVIGNWINSLFHKNDGYATPVVINPMRDEGDFKINKELHLSNERVMSNITFESSRNESVKILNKYKVNKLLFFAKKEFELIKCEGFTDKFENVKRPITKYYSKTDFDNLISVRLIRSMKGENILQKYSPFQDYALGYIEHKIHKIKEKYHENIFGVNKLFDQEKFEDFLKEDKSHITRKLRQAINFIDKSKSKDSIWNWEGNYGYRELSVLEFRKWLGENNEKYSDLKPSKLMDFALPGFFNIDYQLLTLDGKSTKLSKLSSGEQQMIFNINTITYHLYNLQSVFDEKSESSSNRLKYKNISIILDEVELYYHPDTQRELVNNIYLSLENIKAKDEIGIESIHVLFLTHSPFILSDIPAQNILRLEDGKPSINNAEETFGANIHNLLANDFFLENGFMGEFAKGKINEIITFLNHEQIEKKLSSLDKEKDKVEISRLEKQKTELENKSSELTLDNCQERILLIGEPAIRETLLRQYYSIINPDKKRTNSFFERLAEELNYTISKKQ